MDFVDTHLQYTHIQGVSVGIYNASAERSFGGIPSTKQKLLTSEAVEGKVKKQEILKNDITILRVKTRRNLYYL